MKNLFVFLTAALCLFLANRANAQTGGSVGISDCTWTLTGPSGNYTLTIGGTGTIPMTTNIVYVDGVITKVNMPWGLQVGNIKSITIAPGIMGMEDEVFGDCTALTDVTVGWTSDIPVIVSSDVFPNVPLGNVSLHLPPGASRTAYDAAGWTTGFGTVCASGLFGQGNALTWELCGGTLTISGTGPMPWYIIPDYQPWYSLRDKITDIIIEPGITFVGERNFWGCHNLVSIDVPASVESIGERAFESCDKLETVDLSSASSLTVIGNSAFSGCSGLTTIIFPESLEGIGTYTFYNCSKLESVTLPESLTTIGEGAFHSSGLTSVTIPGKTTTIGVDAFHDCSHLETVILTEGVTSIGKDAFNNSGLTSVTIPASVTGIGAGSFSSCTALTDITVQAANADYSSTNGVLFDKIQEMLLQYPAGKAGDSYIIPETVTEIGRSAFYDCTALASVTFPPSLKIIETYAFYNSGLTSITLPSLVKEINMEAFRACAALTSVTIPVSATFLGLYTFSDCSSLTDVKVMWTTAADIPDIAYGLFGDPAQVSQITLHVPFGTEAFYQAANIWKTFTMKTYAQTPAISEQPQNEIVAVDGSASLSVTADVSDGGTLSYEWYSNTSDSNTGGTLITGETGDSYTPPTSATGVIWYYVVITNTNGSADTQTADATSNAASVTVNPAGFKAVTNITDVPAIVMAGEYLPYWSQMKNLLGTVVPADATNKLIEWSVKYSGTTNVGYYTEVTHVYENGQLIAITEYSFSALKTGIYILNATITDGLATGTDYTQDFSVTVLSSTYISNHPQAANYIIDQTPAALSVTATPQNGGILSYQWYSNTEDNNTTGTLITDATGSSYTPPTGTAGTTYYYVEITNTKTDWVTTTVTSQTAAVTVTTATPPVDAETPVISGQPQSVTVAINAPASLFVTAGTGDVGTLSYQWYSNTSASNTGGTLITGATVSSYSPSTATAGTRWYYVTVTNTNNSVSGVKTASVTSNAAGVTVEAVIPAPVTYTITVAPSANGQVTATPQNAEAGETVTLTITPAEGYEPEALVIHRTNAESETIAPAGEGNVRTFTMPGFAVTVRASFRPTTPTGTEALAQPTPLSAYVQNGRLYITGLTPGQPWSLYSITGALISNKTPATSEAELSLPARGIYIIHSGNNTIKVVN